MQVAVEIARRVVRCAVETASNQSCLTHHTPGTVTCPDVISEVFIGDCFLRDSFHVDAPARETSHGKPTVKGQRPNTAVIGNKVMKLVLLPISMLRTMSVDEQDQLARESASLEVRTQNAQTAYKSAFPAMGKVICVIEERLNDLKSDRNPDNSPKKRQIAANTSLATYWESITKNVKGSNGKSVKLNNHGLSCAVAFGTFVRSELITEADYDKNTAQCLELAASISTAVGGDITHDAVNQAADELKDRSKDSAKNLLAILETVKEPTAMTVEQAQKAIGRIMSGGHLPVVIAAVGAEIAHVEDEEVARNAFFGMITANDMWAGNVTKDGARRFSDSVLDAWGLAYQTANAKPTTETPVVTPDSEKPAGFPGGVHKSADVAAAA